MKKLVSMILILMLCGSAMAAGIDWASMTDAEIAAEIAAAQAELDNRGAQSGAAEASFTPLQKGSKGDDVVKLQERLNALGYSVGHADGDFGNKTQAAVESFQRLNDLKASGIVDAETNARLYSDDAVKPTPQPASTPKPVESTLLSEKECLKKARNYAKNNYPGWREYMEPQTVTTKKKVNICFSMTNGFNISLLNLEVDRTTGSVSVVR